MLWETALALYCQPLDAARLPVAGRGLGTSYTPASSGRQRSAAPDEASKVREETSKGTTTICPVPRRRRNAVAAGVLLSSGRLSGGRPSESGKGASSRAVSWAKRLGIEFSDSV